MCVFTCVQIRVYMQAIELFGITLSNALYLLGDIGLESTIRTD